MRNTPTTPQTRSLHHVRARDASKHASGRVNQEETSSECLLSSSFEFLNHRLQLEVESCSDFVVIQPAMVLPSVVIPYLSCSS